MTGCGVINRNSFGVKAVSCTSWMVHGNECCGQSQSFEMQEGGAEGKKKCLGFLFWKITQTMRYGRTHKVFFLMSLNFRNGSPWACQNCTDIGKT